MRADIVCLNTGLTGINVDALSTIDGGNFRGTGLSSLTAVSFPSLASIVNGGTITMSGGSIGYVYIPVLQVLSGILDFSTNALDGSALDALFIALAATVNSGGGTINVTGNPGWPSSASEDARAALTALGVTISL
jgi:hypothetical protein